MRISARPTLGGGWVRVVAHIAHSSASGRAGLALGPRGPQAPEHWGMGSNHNGHVACLHVLIIISELQKPWCAARSEGRPVPGTHYPPTQVLTTSVGSEAQTLESLHLPRCESRSGRPFDNRRLVDWDSLRRPWFSGRSFLNFSLFRTSCNI